MIIGIEIAQHMMVILAYALPIAGIAISLLSFTYTRKAGFLLVLVYFLSPYFIAMLKMANGTQRPYHNASGVHYNIGVPLFDAILVAGLFLLMLSERREYKKKMGGPAAGAGRREDGASGRR